MKILLPSEIGDGRLDTLIRVFHEVSTGGKSTLRLNWSRVESITPAGLAILACLFDSIVEQKVKVELQFVKKRFREIPIIEKIIQAKNYQPLPPAESLSFSLDEMMLQGGDKSLALQFPEQAIHLYGEDLTEEVQFSVKLILNELMINAVDHSSSERYYLYAGKWKKEFHVGVADMGVTIPAKLSQKYPFPSDGRALHLSLQEGITTRRARPGGLGLFHTMGSLKKLEGRLTIVSRNAQLRKYFPRRKTDITPLKHALAGTWCFARFPIK